VIAPPALNQYATLLAGKPVTVACQRDQSFDAGLRGYTLWYGDDPANPSYVQVIYLPYSTCQRLIAIITPPHVSGNRKRPVTRIGSIVSPGEPNPMAAEGINVESDGYALETILHESTHLRENSTDEARVECDTHLNAWQAVKPLGLPAWRAQATLDAMTEAHDTSEVSPINYLADC
jgi:hypothetical protein